MATREEIHAYVTNSYTLGVMSKAWNVEADDVDIATAAIILYAQTTAPIACYTPKTAVSKFMAVDINNNTDELIEFIHSNMHAIGQASQTIRNAPIPTT